MNVFLEVSTCGSCVLNCKYCPQSLIKEKYKGDKFLSFDNFKLALSKLPNNSTICFAGFSEPCVNPSIIDMIKYSFSRGHSVMLLTTLIGLTIESYNEIKDFTYDHFSIHLPDNKLKTNINITNDYLDLLTHIINNPPNGTFLCNHHYGDLHESIKHIIPYSYLLDIHDRSGNLEYDDTNVHHCYKSGSIKCGHRFLNGNSGLLLPNGDIELCCNSWSLNNTLGNIFNQSWEEIMNSETYKNICFNNVNNIDSICRKCEIAIEI